MNVRLTGDTRDAESMPGNRCLVPGRVGLRQAGRQRVCSGRILSEDPRKSRGTCVVEGRDDDKGKGRS